MEYTVNGVTYRQLKDITVKALILDHVPDNDVEVVQELYKFGAGVVMLFVTDVIPLKDALDYASSCNERLQWLVERGFVEVVEAMEEVDINNFIRTGRIMNRAAGSLKGTSFYLSPKYEWSIEIDDIGFKCLVPKRK